MNLECVLNELKTEYRLDVQFSEEDYTLGIFLSNPVREVNLREGLEIRLGLTPHKHNEIPLYGFYLILKQGPVESYFYLADIQHKDFQRELPEGTKPWEHQLLEVLFSLLKRQSTAAAKPKVRVYLPRETKEKIQGEINEDPYDTYPAPIKPLTLEASRNFYRTLELPD